jgi:hypothetical protein
MKFRIVGLGLDKQFTGQNIFRLFPLRPDNTAWINHQFQTTEQKRISMSVHPSTVRDEEGISIRSEECFNRLVEVFKSSTSNMVVPLGKLTQDNLQSVPRARLFGQVFIFEKSFSTAQARV